MEAFDPLLPQRHSRLNAAGRAGTPSPLWSVTGQLEPFPVRTLEVSFGPAAGLPHRWRPVFPKLRVAPRRSAAPVHERFALCGIVPQNFARCPPRTLYRADDCLATHSEPECTKAGSPLIATLLRITN